MQPLSASVSNIDLFRWWANDEELDLEWLLRRLRGEEPQTPAMKAGEALHKVLETATPADEEIGAAEMDGYRFYFNCQCDVVLPTIRELPVEKLYGDLVVRGRVDGLDGKRVTDHKTTGQFDPDRFFEGFQWRFYLDMLDADEFVWNVFVIDEFTRAQHDKDGHLIEPASYDVKQFHQLRQARYPDLHRDCERMAQAYSAFIRSLRPEQWQRKAVAA